MNLLSFISSKIKINHYLCSHDGSLSVPLPFEPEKKALQAPSPPPTSNTWRKMHSGATFSTSSLSKSSLSFVSVYPSTPHPHFLFAQFGETCMLLWFMACPEPWENSNFIITLSSSRFQHLKKKILRSLQSWFTVRWIIHCPFVKEDTLLGWDQLRSSGHKDVTSLSVIHCPFVKEDWGALRSLLHCATHGLAQHLHRLHNGMWGKRRGIGVLATVVVGTVCLLWLTSAEESVDETAERGD